MTKIVDTITHNYSGRQLLWLLLKHWRQPTKTPFTIVARRGEAQWKVNALRVALSKERKSQDATSYYGLSVSETFPYTLESSAYKGEAVVVYFRQSRNQKLAYAFNSGVGRI